MYDMHQSGAIAFGDGTNPIQSAGIVLKALQYVKSFNGTVIQIPEDKSIGANGLMNEGIISTQLGLPGKPAIAEEILIARDIKLARYAESKLHFTGVSSAKSIEYIKRAKESGINISCSVTPYHLLFIDASMQDYDSNLKVNPPLRIETDRQALLAAVTDGTVDCIASHHFPQNWDGKTCEFEYAKNGMTGLQTVFAVVNHLLPELSLNRLTALFSLNARAIFGLPVIHITEGAVADLSLFTKSGQTLLSKEQLKSKSANSPFLDRELTGKVIGTINKDKVFLNS